MVIYVLGGECLITTKNKNSPFTIFGESLYLNYFVFLSVLKKKNSKRLIDNIWLPLVPYKKICKQYLK